MRGRFLGSANPMFNTWCLSGLSVAMPPILVRYTIILIVISGHQLPASAHQIKGSGGKFNIWNSHIAIQRHLQTKTHTQFSETCCVKTINISIWVNYMHFVAVYVLSLCDIQSATIFVMVIMKIINMSPWASSSFVNTYPSYLIVGWSPYMYNQVTAFFYILEYLIHYILGIEIHSQQSINKLFEAAIGLMPYQCVRQAHWKNTICCTLSMKLGI